MTATTEREASEDRAREQIVIVLRTIRATLAGLVIITIAIGVFTVYSQQLAIQVRDQLKGRRTARILCTYIRDTGEKVPRECAGL